MPEKTIYCLTDKGSAVLKDSVGQYLSSLDLDPIKFNIGSYFMCHLEKNTVAVILNKKLKSMDETTIILNKKLNDSSMSYIDQAMIKHQIYLMFSESKTIREILEKMEQDTLWNYQFAIDLNQ
jgi:hypothetical protein